MWSIYTLCHLALYVLWAPLSYSHLRSAHKRPTAHNHLGPMQVWNLIHKIGVWDKGCWEKLGNTSFSHRADVCTLESAWLRLISQLNMIIQPWARLKLIVVTNIKGRVCNLGETSSWKYTTEKLQSCSFRLSSESPTSKTHEHALPDYWEVESGPEWGHFLAREFQAQRPAHFFHGSGNWIN